MTRNGLLTAMMKVFYTIIVFLFITVLYAQIPVAPSGSWTDHPVANPSATVTQYFQPVKINTPEGSRIALAIDENFVQRKTTPYAVGLIIGNDYRLRITDIPFQPGREVFPTVKIIARTYPPQGQELEFPIRIDITQEDIELALDGKFVTRVIYLENPQTAMPIRGDSGTQISTDVSGNVDPIAAAATMGLPVAVVRIGGRIPNTLGVTDPTFFHGSPSWIAFDKTPSNRYEMTRYQNMPRPKIPSISSNSVLPLR
ncbi:MAG: hypothetical protein LBG58_15175 [Planctomycetaceae bacterium]|jgi:hypothetical protein|nr:hypothetical protein [Planctomycetaceae bacterium]